MSSSGAYQFWQRTMIQGGPGTAVRLPGLLHGLGAKRVLLISDEGLLNAGIVDEISGLFDSEQLSSGPVIAGIFTGTTTDAGSQCIDEALALARSVGADGIVALGGGSALDCAKMVKLGLHRNVQSVSELLRSLVSIDDWPEADPITIPHVALPTTAGTGAELSFGAVVYNEALGIKHLIIRHYLEADIAILDALLTVGLPPQLSAACGMDALTHALETLAHPNLNHFGAAQARAAVTLIREYLPLAVSDGSNVEARQAMLNASAMACSALQSHLGAAPVHNFSHALGALYHIHHGEANGVLLPAVLEAMPEFYYPVANCFRNLFDLEAGSPEVIIEQTAAAIRSLLASINHPQDFTSYEIKVSDKDNIISAVALDTLSAFHTLSPEVIEAVCRTSCKWT